MQQNEFSTAQDLVARQAQRFPSRSALVCNGHTLDYASLNCQANQLGSFLRNRGISRGALVGLCLERSLDEVIGLLAILKAGGVYVPLDPDLPPERLSFMIQDAGLQLTLSKRAFVERLSHVATSIVCVDEIKRDVARESTADFESNVSADMPAYVSYTSGSTGKPKGVIHSHRHLVHRMPTMEESDVCCLNVSLSFAFSLVRLFPPLFLGAKLVLIPNDVLKDPRRLARLIELEQITNIGLVPSVLRVLLEDSTLHHLIKSIRTVTVSGAALTTKLIDRFQTVLPGAGLLYGYGTSETGPVTLRNINAPFSSDIRNIGYPVANTQILLLDESMGRVDTGTVAEMYIGSPHLALGYLNRPDLTSERFMDNPYSTESSYSKMFRTRDLARCSSDGHFELLGRIDHQVKVRGFRIEIEEIEHALRSHEAVQEAAVRSYNDLEGETRLAAYIVSSDQRVRLSDLRGYLLNTLPEFMIPFAFVLVDSLPLTTTGKIDRAALPEAIQSRPNLDTPYQAPRNSLETTLVEVWREVLEFEPGIHDHFLDIGVDSLLATRLLVAVSTRLNLELSLLTLFEHPTIAELSIALSGYHDRK
jgi:amino acid adenylation domain-containing protein